MTIEIRKTCTDHATCCNRHFHSLKAFDLHRKGKQCNDPTNIPTLVVWTIDGSCDKMQDCWEDGKRVKYIESVTIWQVAVSESETQRLAELRKKR